MFKLFNKKKPKTTWIASVDSAADLEDYYKELEAALQPLIDEKRKAMFIIRQIYARHDIVIGSSWYIIDYFLDSEVFTDLCVFSDAELATLRKWTQRYKELETEMMNLGEKYRNAWSDKETK